jgi:microcystin-dependent protein
MEAFLGTILPFGFSYAPQGWATRSGQTISIAQNNALFALLGTTYGGNGQTTFMLPDLRGRAPISFGQGPGLSSYVQGQVGGAENTTLTMNNMPAHNHPATAAVQVQVAGTPTGADNTPTAANSFLGASQNAGPASANIWSTALNSPVNMGGTSGSVTVGVAGGSQPFGLMNPYLALNFCIALQGIFPSRN